MTFKLLIVYLISLGFTPASYAGENCITNAAELEAKKASFPKFLQENPPAMFARENFPVAALSFHVVDGKILGEAIYKLFNIKRDNGYVSKLCYNGSELTITLEVATSNDKEEDTYNVKILNDRTLKVNGLEFKETSPANFAKILNMLNDSTDSAATSTTTNHSSAQ